MIAHGRRPKCFGCGRFSTRTVILHGRPVPFCADCPTPEEIRQRCAAIRKRWSGPRLRRGYQQELHGRVSFDAVYTVVVSDDD